TTLNLGFLGSPTIGFQYSFDGKGSFLTAPPAGAKPDSENKIIYDTQFMNSAFSQVTVTSQPGIESYFVSVKSPRFAEPNYDGKNDTLLIFGDDTVLSANDQVTRFSTNNFQGTTQYFFGVKEGTEVPHEPGQFTMPGSTPEERIFVMPSRYFEPDANGNVAGGKLSIGLLSKVAIPDAQKPSVSITPRFRSSRAIATNAFVNDTGMTTINVAGTAYGASAGKTMINVFRVAESNPAFAVQVAAVKLDPKNPNHNYDESTGGFNLTTTWNGLPDITISGKNVESYTFFAQVADGSNPVLPDNRFRATVGMLTASVTESNTSLQFDRVNVFDSTIRSGEYIKVEDEIMLVTARFPGGLFVARGQLGTIAAFHSAFTEIVRVPNGTNTVSASPAATITMNGFRTTPVPVSFFTDDAITFAQPAVDPEAPGGFSFMFNPAGPNLTLSQTLQFKAQVTVSVDQGGFVGVGTTAEVLAAASTTVTSAQFNTLAEANAYLNTIRFVANSQFLGDSRVTVTVNTTTPQNSTYTTSTEFSLLSRPFFLEQQKQGGNNNVIEGDIGVPLNNGKGFQINFAEGFSSEGPYTFTVIEGKLPAGLTLSNTGLISGSPTE
ncbi:MAG: hypothetical protein ACRCZF_17790, partial [Gemmataceae bacterium]